MVNAYPVDNEGACDQEEARRQLLQKDGTLALEAARQQDHHCAWGDADTQLSGLGGSSPPQRLLDVICGVEARCLQPARVASISRRDKRQPA